MAAASAIVSGDRRGRFLVASSQEEFRARVMKSFSHEGAQSSEARSGADALIQLEHGAFGTLVLDPQIDDLDVDELLGTIRARFPALAVMVPRTPPDMEHYSLIFGRDLSAGQIQDPDNRSPGKQSNEQSREQSQLPGDSAQSNLPTYQPDVAKVAPEAREKQLQPAVELNHPQREQLLLDHLPQVQYIARRIHDRLPRQVLLEDLVHAGILGLMDAVRKYDPSKNVQLKHYAEFRIRGAILDSLRQVDWSPRALRRQARRLEQAILDCKARMGRCPTEPEIAAELQISLPGLQHLLGDLRGLDIGSLQAGASDPNGDELAAQNRPAGDQEDPYHLAVRSEMNGLLEKAIGELPHQEHQVLALYHFEELTMKEVGGILGIGESRVSQIHTAAVIRLRARLRELTRSGFRVPRAVIRVTAAACKRL
jgi:RNA polymerase sigma factor FliA